MSISRRQVVVQGAVVGAGVLAAGVPGWDQFARAADVPRRVSYKDLDWNSELVKTLAAAVGSLKDERRHPASDPLKWENLANIHDMHCPHGNWYFLPWHRGYTTMYERIIRAEIGKPDFALPYWDWTNDPVMPKFFTAEKLPNGVDNPLYVPTRRWPAKDPMKPEWVGKPVYDGIMDVRNFESFGTSRPRGQVDTNPGWIRRPTGVEGILESTPHNNVHNAIGGWMPTSFSPRDPIFLAHHSNIDRIWAQWIRNGRMNSVESLWTTMPFDRNFINPDKSAWSPKVSQLTDTMALGYGYDLGGETSLVAARTMPLDDKLTAYFAHPKARTAGVERFVVANKGKAVGNPESSLSISVAVQARLFGLAAHPPRDGARRVYAFLRDVEASDPENAEYRVFVGAEPLASHDTSNPRFVGLFGIFRAMPHAHMRPSFALDLTEAVARVYGGASAVPNDVTIQILPVPATPGGKAGTVTYGTLEIVFVA